MKADLTATLTFRRATQPLQPAFDRVLIAQGYGPALAVDPISGPQCWRARDGHAWKTAKTQGWACAGPRDGTWP